MRVPIGLKAGWPRGVAVALALIALAIKVVAPPGFMLDPSAAKGFAVVICTGQGPVAAADLGGKGGAPAKSSHDAPCAFAGHAAPPLPAYAVLLREGRWTRAAAPAEVFRDLAPGRGLAAPPPPAIGPPVLI